MRIQEPCYAEPCLFILADESLVESVENASFGVCPMDKAAEVVLQPAEVWEGRDGKNPLPSQNDPIDGTVLFDPEQGRFHLWYRTHNTRIPGHSKFTRSRVKAPGSHVCYATSPDGLHWDKPSLGLVNYPTSVDNNMLDLAVPPILSDHLSGVAPNYVEGLDAGLIATMYSQHADPFHPLGITFMTSDDWLRWAPHFPPPLPLDGDAHCLMWDWHRQCYLCTTRSRGHAHEHKRLHTRFRPPRHRRRRSAVSPA